MASAGAGLLRGTFSSDPIAPLERAADTLAELRGLATKAGQMAGIWSAMLPPKERARAEPILARLRAATATSDPIAIRALIESELKAPIDTLFASFDDTPFASASLGQVHRAVLYDVDGGLTVAVKAQHPGIEEALRSDLDNAARFGGVAALLAVPTANDMVDEVRARLEEELDYHAEARWQERFSELLKDDPELSVPRVVKSHSSKRVLTTELATGLTVAEAARRPHAASQARAIRRFLRTCWVEQGLLFADPHAGNWIFGEEGGVTVLDFGSVLRFDETQRAQVREALDAIERNDTISARQAVRGLLRVKASPSSEPTVEMLVQALSPLASNARVLPEQLSELARIGTEAKKKMIGSRLPFPVWMPLTLRALIGSTALLIELEANG
jgi:predicted unusual protein kinase regulating ubiquinone biosynthesis (AarF/ABC1/UbiB family)